MKSKCSLAHPYLLADNRHYPFYLWRKIINAHWLMKYMLVPVYVYSWFSILTLLGMFKPFLCETVFYLLFFCIVNLTLFLSQSDSKNPKEDLGVGLFLSYMCCSCSYAIDRVQILHQSVLYLYASLLCQKQRLHHLASYWNDFCVCQCVYNGNVLV